MAVTVTKLGTDVHRCLACTTPVCLYLTSNKWLSRISPSAAWTPALISSLPSLTFSQEAYIADLDAKSGASLKLTLLNPRGRIWTMVAGGGASVVYR